MEKNSRVPCLRMMRLLQTDVSLKSFRKLIYILDNFKLISGLRLNVNKTIVLKSRFVEICQFNI